MQFVHLKIHHLIISMGQIYTFLFDIDDTIVIDMDFEPTLVNIFDDPVPESVSKLKEFGWYNEWKPVWIHILLNMARESDDIDMFQKMRAAILLLDIVQNNFVRNRILEYVML